MITLSGDQLLGYLSLRYPHPRSHPDQLPDHIEHIRLLLAGVTNRIACATTDSRLGAKPRTAGYVVAT